MFYKISNLIECLDMFVSFCLLCIFLLKITRNRGKSQAFFSINIRIQIHTATPGPIIKHHFICLQTSDSSDYGPGRQLAPSFPACHVCRLGNSYRKWETGSGVGYAATETGHGRHVEFTPKPYNWNNPLTVVFLRNALHLLTCRLCTFYNTEYVVTISFVLCKHWPFSCTRDKVRLIFGALSQDNHVNICFDRLLLLMSQPFLK